MYLLIETINLVYPAKYGISPADASGWSVGPSTKSVAAVRVRAALSAVISELYRLTYKDCG